MKKFRAPGIALGSVVGAGLFLTTVVLGTIAITSASFVIPRTLFLRDIGTYLLAVVVLFWIVADNRLSWYEGVLLLAMYVVYVCSVVLHAIYDRRKRTAVSGPSVSILNTTGVENCPASTNLLQCHQQAILSQLRTKSLNVALLTSAALERLMQLGQKPFELLGYYAGGPSEVVVEDSRASKSAAGMDNKRLSTLSRSSEMTFNSEGEYCLICARSGYAPKERSTFTAWTVCRNHFFTAAAFWNVPFGMSMVLVGRIIAILEAIPNMLFSLTVPVITTQIGAVGGKRSAAERLHDRTHRWITAIQVLFMPTMLLLVLASECLPDAFSV